MKPLEKQSSTVIGKPAVGVNPVNEHSKNLGVLYTGYLDKKNPWKGIYARRFVVLTQEAIHWFLREENQNLFGIERGRISLSDVLSIRVLDENEDSSIFELQTTDHVKRLFRASSKDVCGEWVSAIRSSVKNFSSEQLKAKGGQAAQEAPEEQEVEVLLVSLKSNMATGSDKKKDQGKKYISGTETVIARLPEWKHLISVPDVKEGDNMIISLSNSGIASMTADMFQRRAFESKEFDLVIKDVTLPSSLRCIVYKDSTDNRDGVADSASSKAKEWQLKNLTDDPRVAVNLLVSIMMVVIGLNTLRYLSVNTSLLFVISIALAVRNIVQTIIRFPTTSGIVKQSYILIIMSHAYTSPDDPVVNNPDEEIPQRFINGCDGDLKEAQRRWDITRHWRETEGINNILNTPQPYFFIIKNYCPQFVCGRGKQGHLVFYERPGDFDSVQLKARGIGFEELTRHWLFVSEYQWKYIDSDPMAKSVAILDMQNVTMGTLSGEPLEILKTTVGWANQHYPERSFVICVVNAPYWFSMIWKMVKSLVHENTQRKVRILAKKDVLSGLSEFIDVDQIPEWYGGKLDYGGADSCRFKSPDVVAMNAYVKSLNEGLSAEQLAAQKSAMYDGDGSGAVNNAPPGLLGDTDPSLAASMKDVTAEPATTPSSGVNAQLTVDTSAPVPADETPAKRTPSTGSASPPRTPQNTTNSKTPATVLSMT